MEDQYEGFLNQVMGLLNLRRGAAVLMLVHQQSGLEIVSNVQDIIHKRGMLETAIDILKEIRSVSDEEVRRAQSEAELEAIKATAAMNGKGPVQ